MTLQEFFETKADKETIYHISSGSSFFFIGNKSKYKQDINEISVDFKENAERLLTRAEIYMDGLEHRLPNFIDEVQNISTDDKDYIKNLNNYLTRLKNIEPNIKKSISAIKNQKEYLKYYTPLQTREVLDIYPRIQNDGMVIKIAGGEDGRYWFKHEYDTKIVEEG